MAFQTVSLTNGVTIGEIVGDSITREEGDAPRITWRFKINGADDASTAYASLLSWLAVRFADGYGGIASYNVPLSNIRLSATASPFSYTAEVTFEFPTQTPVSNEINDSGYTLPDIEPNDYQFSTLGGSSHITHSLQTLSATPAVSTDTTRDFGGGIGWNGESFDGCDVITPKQEFSITVSLPKDYVTTSYRLTMYAATGAINSAEFDGMGAGCVLFKGFTARPAKFEYSDENGNKIQDWYWRATYSFEAAASVSLNFGGQTIVKRGFDYLWRLMEKIEDATTHELKTTVKQINVERVYPEFDFDLFGLPLPANDTETGSETEGE